MSGSYASMLSDSSNALLTDSPPDQKNEDIARGCGYEDISDLLDQANNQRPLQRAKRETR